MDNCIFCKIVKGEIPCNKIFENDNCFAFLDIQPQSKGHCLVIPKKHFANIYDISDESVCQVMSVVGMLSKHIKKELKPLGINILQNNEPAAGQTVFHYHVHIIPKYEVKKIEEDVPKCNQEELDNLQEILKKSLLC